MLISQLTGDEFRTGRYAPEWVAYVLQQLERNFQFIQAQNFTPVGGAMGTSKKLGSVFEIQDDITGYSVRRELYEKIAENIVASTNKTIFMSRQADKVVTDLDQVRETGDAFYRTQLDAAIQRLYRTFVFLVFNADSTKVDATRLLKDASTTMKYEYDGYEKYFKDNAKQVISDTLYVADYLNNYNLRYVYNNFFASVNDKVDVNGNKADIVYTTRTGKRIMAGLEVNKFDYQGMYKFVNGVSTYDGIPIIEVPDHAVPAAWKAKGEFVLFANQDENAGNRIMIPADGSLISTKPDTQDEYVVTTPMSMTFAPVFINKKAASLCFIADKDPNAVNP